MESIPENEKEGLRIRVWQGLARESRNGMNSVLRPTCFVPFDERRAVRILPAESAALDGERGRWREAFQRLSPGERFLFEQHLNRQVQSCLDRGLGECHLRDPACATVLREELRRDDGHRHHLGDFVIMPNHVHLLITPVDDVEPNSFRSTKLEQILKSIKGASAAACNRRCDRAGSFWQADSYDHMVRSLEQLSAYREYIARNPLLLDFQLPAETVYRADWTDAWFQA